MSTPAKDARAGRDPRERAEALRENLAALFDVDGADDAHLSSAVQRVVPEDIAAILEDFSLEQKLSIFRAIHSDEAKSVVIEETDQESHDELLDALSKEEIVAILGEMPVDDLVDHLEDLAPEEKAHVLANLEPDEARVAEELAQYAEDTAGGMMTTEFLELSTDLTSHQALAAIQGNLDLEVISYIYITEDDSTLRGIVSIRDILRSKPDTPVQEYMKTDVIHVNVFTDREEVAAAANKYNLSVIPVLDDENQSQGHRHRRRHSRCRRGRTLRRHAAHGRNGRRAPVSRIGDGRRAQEASVPDGDDDGRHSGDVSRRLLRKERSLHINRRRRPTSVGNVGATARLCARRQRRHRHVDSHRPWAGDRRDQREPRMEGAPPRSVDQRIGRTGSGRHRRRHRRAASYSNKEGLEGQTMTIFGSIGCGLAASISWAALVGAAVPVLCRLSGRIDPAIASGPFVTMLCDLSASAIFLTLVLLFL